MMTWNEHVTHQREAAEFMGLPPPPPINLGFDFLWAPPPKVQRCRRPVAPSVPYPERATPSTGIAGRPYSLFMRTPLSPAERAYKPESDRILALYEHMRPTDAPDDCRVGMPKAIRPCPWASCRYHLGVTLNASGSIKVDHGHLDFDRLEDTCAIDVAERGPQTQEAVAAFLGISVNWVRPTERMLRRRLLRKTRAAVSSWSAPDENGRLTCVPCAGAGEVGDGNECMNCDGEGYRWTDRHSL